MGKESVRHRKEKEGVGIQKTAEVDKNVKNLKYVKTGKSKKEKIVDLLNGIYYAIKRKIKSKHKYSFFMGLFIIFLICSGFFQLASELYYSIFYNFSYIESSNTDKLKEIFFGNKPYLVYCKNDKYGKLHPNINSSKLLFPQILNVAIVNCKSMLPSQQNIYQRFNLKEDIPAFVISFGRKPKPISHVVLDSKKTFLNFIHEALIFNVPFFSKFPQFQTKCLNENKKCVLFISKLNLRHHTRKYNYINDLFISNKFYSINPMIVDNNRYQLRLSEEIFQSYEKKKELHVLCLFNHTENGEENYYGFFYDDNLENFKKISEFLQTCMNATHKSSEAVRLAAKPKIKYRSPKKQT